VHIIKKHFVEVEPSRHLPKGSDLKPGRVHRNDERRETSVLGVFVGVTRSTQDIAPVRVLSERRP